MMAPPTPKAPPMVPATKPERTPSSASLSTGSRGSFQRLGGPPDHVAFARIARFLDRLVQREPPDLLHLVVVEGCVSSHCPHQEEGHLLANALALPDEPVRDLTERAHDLGLQAGLFLNLSKGRLFGLLAALDHALGQPPGA